MHDVTAFMEHSGVLLEPVLRLSVERGGKPEETLKFAADQLTQGCYILKELLHMEKELLFPPIDAILTEMDYLFS